MHALAAGGVDPQAGERLEMTARFVGVAFTVIPVALGGFAQMYANGFCPVDKFNAVMNNAAK